MAINWLLISFLIVLVGYATAYVREVHDPAELLGILNTKERFSTDVGLNKISPPEETDPNFWRKLAGEELASRLSRKQPDEKRAKNVIMFLGDGMSMTTVAAARILKGQRKGNTGEEDALSFEKFPYTGMSRTYCTDSQVPDSACTATAYLTGVKTNILNIGVSAKVTYNDFVASNNPENHVSSIAAWAQAAGKSTGIVTTTTLTHASPTGTYGHVANRMWECDTDVESYGIDPNQTMDLATQLVTQNPGRNFEVMFGGGMGKFLPNSVEDSHGKPGERNDGKNLLSHWQGLHPGGVLVTNRKQLLSVNVSDFTNIIGLFQSGLMDFHLDADAEKQPTLAELTSVTIQKLSQNENGYFAFIEGGLIDYGNHDTKPTYSLDEALEFEKAVQLARTITDPEDTLIVVTSDHGHTLSFAGYPGRGTPILGLNHHDKDSNGIKYAVLNYAAGPNQYLDEQGHRIDLSEKIGSPDFVAPSYISKDQGVHSGEDVGVFASGPQSHLFTGVMQQNSIPHFMAYAACIGDGRKLCDEN